MPLPFTWGHSAGSVEYKTKQSVAVNLAAFCFKETGNDASGHKRILERGINNYVK